MLAMGTCLVALVMLSQFLSPRVLPATPPRPRYSAQDREKRDRNARGHRRCGDPQWTLRARWEVARRLVGREGEEPGGVLLIESERYQPGL